MLLDIYQSLDMLLRYFRLTLFLSSFPTLIGYAAVYE